jgi:hypothetical protein
MGTILPSKGRKKREKRGERRRREERTIFWRTSALWNVGRRVW